MPERKHRSQLETTNDGHCFSECSCGWHGGVYPSRHDARYAWVAHTQGRPIPPHVKPPFLIGNSPRGMDA